jgi:hypothetical protein
MYYMSIPLVDIQTCRAYMYIQYIYIFIQYTFLYHIFIYL